MSDVPEFGTVFWPTGNRTVPRVAEVGCDVCLWRRNADVTTALTKVRCCGKSGHCSWPERSACDPAASQRPSLGNPARDHAFLRTTKDRSIRRVAGLYRAPLYERLGRRFAR